MKCRSVNASAELDQVISRKGKGTGHSSCNGYALHQALLVLLLMGQLCGLLCVLILQAGSLRQAAFQSEKDLLIIQEARKMAEDVLWERRCLDEQETFERTVALPFGSLELEDHQTYLLLTCKEKDRKIVLRFYYDETRYYRLEYVRNTGLSGLSDLDSFEDLTTEKEAEASGN